MMIDQLQRTMRMLAFEAVIVNPAGFWGARSILSLGQPDIAGQGPPPIAY